MLMRGCDVLTSLAAVLWPIVCELLGKNLLSLADNKRDIFCIDGAGLLKGVVIVLVLIYKTKVLRGDDCCVGDWRAYVFVHCGKTFWGYFLVVLKLENVLLCCLGQTALIADSTVKTLNLQYYICFGTLLYNLILVRLIRLAINFPGTRRVIFRNNQMADV